jgi:hypothetical protein
LPLPLLLVAVLLVIARHVRRDSARADAGGPPLPGMWTVVSLSLVLSLLLAWAVLPLPEWTGALVLERVKGTRVPLALGLASVLIVAIAGMAMPRRRTRPWEGALWAVAVGAMVGLSMWAAGRMPWRDNLVSTKLVLAYSILVAAGFGLVAAGRFRRTAAILLAGFAAWSWALVNPLYQGLGPLDSDPVARVMRPLAEERPGSRVMVFGDEKLVAIVRSTGMQSLAGTTPYPDAQLMQRLAPDQRGLWNNYATYRWLADPSADRATIRQIKGTTMELRLNPCSPDVAAFGAVWAVSETPIQADCLRPRQVIHSGALTRYLYSVTTATP